MKKIGSFVKKYWYIPFVIILAILTWVVTKGRAGTPIKQTQLELEAIRAAARAREAEEKHGAVVAKAKVKEEYRETLEKLDEKKKAEARELEDDPAKLAKFLVRAGGVG